MVIDFKKPLHRSILQILRAVYTSNASEHMIFSALKDGVNRTGKADFKKAISYLEKTGLIETKEDDDTDMELARITAKGVDILDGAITDPAVDPPPANLIGLASIRDHRRGILYTATQYPKSWINPSQIKDSFNNDGTFTEFGLDQIRFHIWYLAEKGYLEIKQTPLSGSSATVARITASGINLCDKKIEEVGITDGK